MKKKLLIGIESSGGGAFKHVVYLATKLPKEKFDITLIYSAKRNENISRELEILKKSNIRLIEFPISKQLNLINDIKAFSFIFNLISKENYDVIHAHSSKAGLLFRLAGYFNKVPKIYFTPHCFHFQSKKGIYKVVSVFYERLISRITNKIIISDNECKEAIIHKISNKEKLTVINNAIYFDEIKFDKKIKEIKKEFKIPDNTDFIVGGIGRLEHQKDWETYIQVANEVIKKTPKTIFLIVGEGNQKSYLENLIESYGLSQNIMLTGFVKDIHKIYNIIDVFVSTSLWEGLPYVVLEATQYDKPVITTNAISDDFSFFNKCCDIKDFNCISKQIVKYYETVKINNQKSLFSRKYDKPSFNFFLKKHINLYLENI